MGLKEALKILRIYFRSIRKPTTIKLEHEYAQKIYNLFEEGRYEEARKLHKEALRKGSLNLLINILFLTKFAIN